ncbi:MAG: ABC transporter permease [Anaerolineae bacterium]|jgi:oligopeptide transport system permease protein
MAERTIAQEKVKDQVGAAGFDLSRPPESLWRDAWRRLLRNRAAVAGGVFIVIIVFTAIFADDGIVAWALRRDAQPLLAPYGFKEVDFENTRAAPSFQRTEAGRFPHVMGTDKYGRDVFSRIVYGSRVSIAIGFLCSAVILLFGLFYGSISGYMGGSADTLMMRFVDLVYAFPTLLFIILVMVILGSTSGLPAIRNLVLAIGLVSWMGTARLVRGQYLSVKEKEFVLAARMVGAGDLTIISRHLLPNSLGPIVVSLTLGIPNLIMFEATLSFIGLGVPPPFPSWGQMLNEGWRAMRADPHLIIFPALMLSLVMLAFNFLGDGLRDALDPQMRGTM